MKRTLLKPMLLLCALIAGSGSVRADESTIALSSSTIKFEAPYGSEGSTYYSTALSLKADNETTYTGWTRTDVCAAKSQLSLKKSGSVTSPAVTSGNGYKVTITYTFSSASSASVSLQIGDETEQSSTTAGTLSAETTSTSASFKITAGSTRAVYITEIKIEPKASAAAKATTTTIDASGITNKDVYVNTSAGSLAYSVTVTEGGAAVAGATVSWKSSNEKVATVDASGNVTLLKAGRTNITATYAGNSDYVTSTSDPYELIVTSSAPKPITTTSKVDNWNTLFNTTYNGNISPVIELSGDTDEGVKITYGGGSSQYIKDTDLRIYNGSSFSAKAPDGYVITEVEFTGTTSSDKAPIASVGTFSYSTNKWTGVANEFTLSRNSGSGYTKFESAKFTLVQYATITLASACTDGEGKYYGTYSNGSAFVVPADLTVSAIKVVDGKLAITNYATGDVVKANTGVMVSSATAGDHTVVLSNETGTEKDGNMLKASGDAGITASEMHEANTKFYRLTMHNGTTIGFWWGAAYGDAFDLAANKAYLAVPADAQVSGFSFDEDMTTGISSNLRETATDGRYYTLQGVEVAQPTKGLYIVNGKKVILK